MYACELRIDGERRVWEKKKKKDRNESIGSWSEKTVEALILGVAFHSS